MSIGLKLFLVYTVSLILMISGVVLWVSATDSSASLPGKILFGVGVVLAVIGDFYRIRNYGARWLFWNFTFSGIAYIVIGTVLVVIKLVILPDLFGWGLIGLLIVGGAMQILFSKGFKEPEGKLPCLVSLSERPAGTKLKTYLIYSVSAVLVISGFVMHGIYAHYPDLNSPRHYISLLLSALGVLLFVSRKHNRI